MRYLLLLLTFNCFAQIGGGISSSFHPNNKDYIYWCDTIDGDYQTILQVINGKTSTFYDSQNNTIDTSNLATLGACNSFIEVCDTCNIVGGEVGQNEMVLCPETAVFKAVSSPTWSPNDVEAAPTLPDDVSGYINCAALVAPSSPVGNSIIGFDFSQIPECGVIDSIIIEVTGAPNGGGYALYAYNEANTAAGTIVTANGNQAEYQQYGANSPISAGGLTFNPANPFPQLGSGTYTVSVPYAGLTQNQIDNFKFAILIQNSTDVIELVQARVVYTCSESTEPTKYLRVVIDTTCQAPIPITGQITIAPTPPQEECLGEYFLRCDDVNNDLVGEVIYYDYVTTCYLNGVQTQQIITQVDEFYQPYTPVNANADCDASLLPPIDKVVLCDDGNNDFQFVQFSYVAAGNVIVTNQTELDEMTPYTLVGGAIKCPELQVLDKKCYQDATGQGYFTITYSNLTTTLYTYDELEVKQTEAPVTLIEVCCEPAKLSSTEKGCNGDNPYIIEYYTYGDPKVVSPPDGVDNWCKCDICQEGVMCLNDEQLGTNCSPYQFTDLVTQSQIYTFTINEINVTDFVTQVNNELNALGIGSFIFETYNQQPLECATQDGGYKLSYKGTETMVSYSLSENCDGAKTALMTEIDCNSCSDGVSSITQTKEAVPTNYADVSISANTTTIITRTTEIGSVTASVTGGTGTNNNGGNRYTVSWITPIGVDYGVYIQHTSPPSNNALIASHIIKTPTSVSFVLSSGDDGNSVDESRRGDFDILITGDTKQVVTNVSN